MPARGADLIPVVQKSYDLCAGLYTQVNRFPRAERGLLGRVLLEDALERDMFLTAERAKEFGVVDKVIDKRPEATDKA